jgi:hypothetical protein
LKDQSWIEQKAGWLIYLGIKLLAIESPKGHQLGMDHHLTIETADELLDPQKLYLLYSYPKI